MQVSKDMVSSAALAVPFGDRKMTQADRAVLIGDKHHFLHREEKLKRLFVLNRMPVVIPDNQMLISLQLTQIPAGRITIAICEIADNVNVIRMSAISISSILENGRPSIPSTFAWPKWVSEI